MMQNPSFGRLNRVRIRRKVGKRWRTKSSRRRREKHKETKRYRGFLTSSDIGTYPAHAVLTEKFRWVSVIFRGCGRLITPCAARPLSRAPRGVTTRKLRILLTPFTYCNTRTPIIHKMHPSIYRPPRADPVMALAPLFVRAFAPRARSTRARAPRARRRRARRPHTTARRSRAIGHVEHRARRGAPRAPRRAPRDARGARGAARRRRRRRTSGVVVAARVVARATVAVQRARARTRTRIERGRGERGRARRGADATRRGRGREGAGRRRETTRRRGNVGGGAGTARGRGAADATTEDSRGAERGIAGRRRRGMG